MRDQTGYFNSDVQLAAWQLNNHGLRTSGSRELLNWNLTLQNPRNRVLSFPNVGTDTRRLWSIAIQSAACAFADEVEDFLLNVAKSQNPNAEGAIYVGEESILVPKNMVSTTLLVRADRLHLIHNSFRENLLSTLPETVFRQTFLQEAILARLQQALPHLKLGYSFFNVQLLSIDEDDSRLTGVIERDRVFDLEMISIDKITTANEYMLDSTPYWKTLKAAFMDEDTAAIHQIFGQEDD